MSGKKIVAGMAEAVGMLRDTDFVIGKSRHTGKTCWETTRAAAEAAGMTEIAPAPTEMRPHIALILAANEKSREPPQSVVLKLQRMLEAHDA